MKYKIKVIFRLKGEDEEYSYKYTQNFTISDISKLCDIVTNPYHTVISLNVELI